MQFVFPQILVLIPLALLALGLFFIWVRHRKQRLMDRFGERALVEKLTRGISKARQNWKYALIILAVMLLLFSLSRPQYGVIERPLQRRGVEVAIAIDCSRSMLGEDIKPNRMTRARQQLKGLVQRLEGDNVGIIAFAGIPIIQCPMTSDYDMALNLLDSIDVDSVPVQGTGIAAAVRKSFDVFRTAGKGYKVLVLLTDGEDHEGEVMAAVNDAKERGIKIYAIGIGSPQGSPIPAGDGGYKEADGVKVNSKLNFDLLSRMALDTGGKAILANVVGDLELREIYNDVASLKEADLNTTATILHAERFQYFLAGAILLLFAETMISEKRRRIHEEGVGRFD